MMTRVIAYGREVCSPFGLLGQDENAFTFALGYLYGVSPAFLVKTLHRLGIKGIWQKTLASVEISLQKNRSVAEGGITDIELWLPGVFHIIIEAKVGMSTPPMEQCLRYLPRLKEDTGRLAILQNPDYEHILQDYGIKKPELRGVLVGLNWSDLLDDAFDTLKQSEKNTKEEYWLKALIKYMEEEFYMGTYTTELWIVPASKEPLWTNGLSFYDIHLQKGRFYLWKEGPKSKMKPLYMAFREHGFDTIQRIIKIEHNIKPIDILPELKHVPKAPSEKESWPNIGHTIWHLSEPIPIGRKIETGPGMYNRHVTCNLDMLFTCDTVKEIEEKMGERRR